MSKIEWTQRTWNPIVSGCSMVMAFRLSQMGQEKYKNLTKKTRKGIVWNGKINIDLDDKALFEPLKRKKTTMYFVNSMTDLFHKDVPFEAVDKIMAVIALCPHHTFQILTKRPERMKDYFRKQMVSWVGIIPQILVLCGYEEIKAYEIGEKIVSEIAKNDYTLPNLWLGVSIETQEQANKRIPLLLETPAKVRFLSAEPLLGDIDLTHIEKENDYRGTLNVVKKIPKPSIIGFINSPISTIDWVIVGGESGRNARPMHPDWVRSIQRQCLEAKVPFFFKQWGEYAPFHDLECDNENLKGKKWYNFDPDTSVCKVSKHKAGKMIDGKEYLEMPIK